MCVFSTGWTTRATRQRMCNTDTAQTGGRQRKREKHLNIAEYARLRGLSSCARERHVDTSADRRERFSRRGHTSGRPSLSSTHCVSSFCPLQAKLVFHSSIFPSCSSLLIRLLPLPFLLSPDVHLFTPPQLSSTSHRFFTLAPPSH